jgi:hypothetical protein
MGEVADAEVVEAEDEVKVMVPQVRGKRVPKPRGRGLHQAMVIVDGVTKTIKTIRRIKLLIVVTVAKDMGTGNVVPMADHVIHVENLDIFPICVGAKRAQSGTLDKIQ